MLVNNKNQERKGGHYQTLEKHPFLGRFAIQGRHIKTRPVPKEKPQQKTRSYCTGNQTGLQSKSKI